MREFESTIIIIVDDVSVDVDSPVKFYNFESRQSAIAWILRMHQTGDFTGAIRHIVQVDETGKSTPLELMLMRYQLILVETEV